MPLSPNPYEMYTQDDHRQMHQPYPITQTAT